jgi:hypothetical protein
MKLIKITDKNINSLSYQVENDKLESFIANIPQLGFGKPERIISRIDPETKEIIEETLPAEFTYTVKDLNTDSDYILQVCYDNRRKEYPPISDYLDAKAKQSSTDPNIVSAGNTQEANYLAACLAVKAKYPKPS